jgi:DNA-binding MarR family transcriptional regulator
MTASGITRVLMPMEKIGLVKSGPLEKDARVRTVQIAKGGLLKFSEARERLEILCEDIIPISKHSSMNTATKFLVELGGKTLMN